MNDYGPLNYVYCLKGYEKCALGEVLIKNEKSELVFQHRGYWEVKPESANTMGVFVVNSDPLETEFTNLELVIYP